MGTLGDIRLSDDHVVTGDEVHTQQLFVTGTTELDKPVRAEHGTGIDQKMGE